MPEFNNIEEIITEFNLDSRDAFEIKKELHELLKIVHSGQNSDGQFKDKVAELMFHKINSALEFVKTETLPKNRAELTKIIKELIPYKPDEKKAEKLNKQLKTEIKSFKRSNLVPKISASAVTIILSFIWFFPSKAIEHPVLGNIINPTNRIFTIVWITSILITGLIWLIARRKERMIEDGIKKLNIESVQNSILSQFIQSKEWVAERENKTYITFTKDDIVKYFTQIDIRKLEVVHYSTKKISKQIKHFLNKVFGLEETIDIAIAQSLAEIISERLISKDIITEIQDGNLSTTYRKEIIKNDKDFPF